MYMYLINMWCTFWQGETIEDIPEAVIQDCAQLVKANSIQGQYINY